MRIIFLVIFIVIVIGLSQQMNPLILSGGVYGLFAGSFMALSFTLKNYKWAVRLSLWGIGSGLLSGYKYGALRINFFVWPPNIDGIWGGVSFALIYGLLGLILGAIIDTAKYYKNNKNKKLSRDAIAKPQEKKEMPASYKTIEKTNNPSSSDNIPMTMTETTSKDEHALLNSQHSENEHSSEDINTEFYATALNEIENETYDKGIWAKAFAECEGHETETNAKYIKLRAAQLQSTEWARQEAERLEAERIEAERLEPERLEAERLEAERIEAERLEAERIEAERLEAERIEASLKAIEAEEKNSNLGCLVFIIISMILFFIASK